MAIKRSSETVAALLSSAPPPVRAAEPSASVLPAEPADEPGSAPETSHKPRRRRGPPPRPPKPIRFTLDLNKADHAYLKEFALAAEVDAARIMRALIDELRNDEELAERIRDKVWEQ